MAYSILSAVVSTIVGLFVNFGMNWLLRNWEKLRVYLNLVTAVVVLSLVGFIPSNFSDTTALVAFISITSSLLFPTYLIESLKVRDLIVYDTFITG